MRNPDGRRPDRGRVPVTRAGPLAVLNGMAPGARPDSPGGPVIAGLPWESWLLLLGSVAVPLGAVIAYAVIQRRGGGKDRTRSASGTAERPS